MCYIRILIFFFHYHLQVDFQKSKSPSQSLPVNPDSIPQSQKGEQVLRSEMGGFSINNSAVEEIHGLIRVHDDGHVDRFPIVRDVPCTWSVESSIVSEDVAVTDDDDSGRLSARFYVPRRSGDGKLLPLVVYFHGGGFCVASAAWSCYHEFLSRMAARIGCVVVSVNYRLAPEHRLPAAYDDGVRAVKWIMQQEELGSARSRWWSSRCDFRRSFVGGDSAGGTIAYNVALRLPTMIAGVILIQPFFGGEERTSSEKNLLQPTTSALTLAVSDTYWRLALPAGSTRDHHWCNPVVNGRVEDARQLPRFLLFVAELDILRDRQVEFCRAMKAAGKNIEMVVHGGVGHAFHVLGSSRLVQGRRQEMIDQINNFICLA